MVVKERQAVMRPLDIVILLKKISPAGYDMNGKQLAESLGISAAEVSIALERNRIAGLVDSQKSRVNVLALMDFLSYGIRYCFPVQPGSLVRGIPTASSANPIKSIITSNGEDFVWRNPHGTARGQSITPLYCNVPVAVKNDVDLYAMLTMVDSLRLGRTRERQAAIEELKKYMNQYVSFKQQ